VGPRRDGKTGCAATRYTRSRPPFDFDGDPKWRRAGAYRLTPSLAQALLHRRSATWERGSSHTKETITGLPAGQLEYLLSAHSDGRPAFDERRKPVVMTARRLTRSQDRTRGIASRDTRPRALWLIQRGRPRPDGEDGGEGPARAGENLGGRGGARKRDCLVFYVALCR